MVNITYDGKILANKTLIRTLSFLFKPIFSANHRWAMACEEESLKRELTRRRATIPENAAACRLHQDLPFHTLCAINDLLLRGYKCKTFIRDLLSLPYIIGFKSGEDVHSYHFFFLGLVLLRYSYPLCVNLSNSLKTNCCLT